MAIPCKMKSKDNLLFVLGPPNTATSTMVGMLNCHPEIFILYEVNMAKSEISHYGSTLIDKYPDTRHMFHSSGDMVLNYAKLYHWCNEKLTGYRYVGDKFACMDVDLIEKLKLIRTILTCRDIRTWLCKKGTIKNYRTDIDIVRPAIDYTAFLIKSFTLNKCIRIRLEDFIEKNNLTIRNISQFLEIELLPWVADWWKKLGTWSEDDPKSVLRWFDATHASSYIRPNVLDTFSEIASHPFWDEILPIFDKYYFNLTNEFDHNELERDAARLEKLTKFSPITLRKGYRKIVSASLSQEHMISGKIIEKDRILY